jgi:hypothetical protein
MEIRPLLQSARKVARVVADQSVRMSKAVKASVCGKVPPVTGRAELLVGGQVTGAAKRGRVQARTTIAYFQRA